MDNIFDLLPFAQNLVQKIKIDDTLPVICLSEERVNQLAVPTVLDDVAKYVNELDGSKLSKVHETIVWVEACLRNSNGINSTVEAAKIIQQRAIQALTPPRFFAPKSSFDPDPKPEASALTLTKWRLMAIAGLRLLTHLRQLVATHNTPPLVELVTCLASFTHLQDPWNSPAAHETATRLLTSLLPPSQTAPSRETPELLTEILETHVKPLFAKDPNSTLTEQGRKAAFPLPGKLLFSEAETLAKPWKFRDIWIVSVFQWTLGRLEESSIESQWPLLIPPLLTILDDELTANKIRGCELLRAFLQLTPSALLKRTGLGEVFQDTLIPCLSYLPSLTPETESLDLLRAVYPTLLALLRARFLDTKDKAQKEKVMDKIMRQGVLGGYAHAGEYVEIATLLVTKMGDLVDEMGIDSVKHLKDIIPLLSTILTAPFATAHTRLLQAAASTLQTIILNDWARIEYYHGEILMGILGSWCVIKAEGRRSVDLDRLCETLKTNVELLRVAIGTDSAVVQDIDTLLQGDSRLQDLQSQKLIT